MTLDLGKIKFYYDRLFPWDTVVQMFKTEKGEREYVFGFISGSYKRHMRAETGYDLGSQYSQCKAVVRVDIGPVYAHSELAAASHHSYQAHTRKALTRSASTTDSTLIHSDNAQPGFNALSASSSTPSVDLRSSHSRDSSRSSSSAHAPYIGNTLKFDFDAKDFPRSCGCGASSACARCFALVIEAAARLVEVLRVDFGITRVLPVFSGNRGIHVWVYNSEFMGETFRVHLCTYLKNRYQLPIDVNVTAKISHMLKAPFSVHPSTGKLALPYTFALMRTPDFLDIAYRYDTIPAEFMAGFVNAVKAVWQ